MFSDVDKAKMTDKESAKEANLEMQTEGVACMTAKWNGPRTAEGRQRVAKPK